MAGKSKKVLGLRTAVKPKELLQPTKEAPKRRTQITGPRKMTSVASVLVMERRYKVMQMRREGYTLLEIAQTLRISPDTAREDEVFVLQLTLKGLKESAEEARQIQLDRLDALIKTYTPMAHGYWGEKLLTVQGKSEMIPHYFPPDPMAAGLLLRVEERRSKLLALDIPEKKELEITGIRQYVGVDLNKV